MNATLGWASREAEAAALRMRDLCQKLGNIEGLVGALMSLAGGYTLRGEIPQAIQAAQTIVDMVVPAGDPGIQVWAHHVAAVPRYHAGEFRRAREHAEKALEFYTPERERALVGQTHMPSAFACCHTQAMVFWLEGYPEQSAASVRRGWSTIETLNIPACTTMATGYMLHIHYLRRDPVAMEPLATRAYEQSTEDGSLFWSAQARIFRAWARTMNGDTDAGIVELKNALEIYRQTGSGLLMPHWSLMLAEAQWSAGRADEALATVSAGLAHSAEFGERCTDSELHTLGGVILSAQGATTSAEASFRRAIEVAREQAAKMFELQAALALAKLQKEQGRVAEARELLQPLNDWFQEGRDLPALRETAEILESLSLARGA
jgi:tetratricopeptide (TPR) repeat protein